LHATPLPPSDNRVVVVIVVVLSILCGIYLCIAIILIKKKLKI
jgi:hypothetical protein